MGAFVYGVNWWLITKWYNGSSVEKTCTNKIGDV